MTRDELGYALSKQVPDMARGVTVQTNYGELILEGRDAERVAALVRRLLEERLRTAERCDAADHG
jgi:hypothetical protein